MHPAGLFVSWAVIESFVNFEFVWMRQRVRGEDHELVSISSLLVGLFLNRTFLSWIVCLARRQIKPYQLSN